MFKGAGFEADVKLAKGCKGQTFKRENTFKSRFTWTQ